MILDANANKYGLPPSLITPIAAKGIDAIKTYVGDIVESTRNKSALVVDFVPLAPPDNLAIWDHNRSSLISHKKQIWVHVDYSGYRNYYIEKCDCEDVSNYVIDHIYNRRLARIYGYEFLRLIHISREANSSSGRGMESNVMDYGNFCFPSREQMSVISYADPSDLAKMLDIKIGGFPLDPVRDAMKMFYP